MASVTFFNLVSGGTLIGASGAINGIVGIYLILFPLNDIDCLLLAGFGGFLAGISVGLIMLKLKIVKIERYELSLIDVFQGKGRRRNNTLDPELDVLYKKRVGMLSDKDCMGMHNESNCAYAEQEQPKEVKVKNWVSPTVSVRDGKMYFHCECGNKIKVPKSLMGKKAKCPLCEVKIEVPVINL